MTDTPPSPRLASSPRRSRFRPGRRGRQGPSAAATDAPAEPADRLRQLADHDADSPIHGLARAPGTATRDSPASKLGAAKRVVKQFVSDKRRPVQLRADELSPTIRTPARSRSSEALALRAADGRLSRETLEGAGGNDRAVGQPRRGSLHEPDRPGLHRPVARRSSRSPRTPRSSGPFFGVQGNGPPSST